MKIFNHYVRLCIQHLHQKRKGITLVELLLFVTLMAMMGSTILPLLFNSTESRQRQDAIALVEQNGAQIMQVITQAVRDSERILDPPTGGTGFILALQTESGATNPTIIAKDSGAIVMIQGRARRVLSSTLVGVTSFAVDNTSVSSSRQSVAVTLGLRRVIRLHQPLVYESHFDTVVNLFPDDTLVGDDCGCITPYCDTGSGMYIWQVCSDDLCVPHSDFECDPED